MCLNPLPRHNLYDFKEEEVKSFMFTSDILTLQPQVKRTRVRGKFMVLYFLQHVLDIKRNIFINLCQYILESINSY